jgi:hypothetical protein
LFTAYSSFFLLRILALQMTLLSNKVFDSFAQHSLLKQSHARIVPLIGRLKLFNELRAYVLPFLPRIALVRKSFPLYKVLSRVASFLLSKQRFSLPYPSLGINCNWLAVTKRLYHRAFKRIYCWWLRKSYVAHGTLSDNLAFSYTRDLITTRDFF